MCAFPPLTNRWQSPPPPAKKKVIFSQSCIRLRWNTCSRPGWGEFFHPRFRVCSGVGSPELGLKGRRDLSWFPSTGAEGESRTDTEEEDVCCHFAGLDSMRVCVHVCVQFPLEVVTQKCLNLRSLSSATPPFCFSYWDYFLAFSVSCCWPWVWQEYPKYVSGNQSLVFSFAAFFPT